MKLKVLIAVLSLILAGLLVLVPFVHRIGGTQNITQAASHITSESGSAPATQPDSSMPSIQSAPTETTQPESQQPVQPTTQPVNNVYSDNPTVNAFIHARMSKWSCPVKDAFGEVVGTRVFASSRGGGKRAHAGLDFVAPHGTKVYAITSGTVQRVAVFYQNTWAVEVLNDDGSILRYCEIATKLKAGDYVKQGDQIGTILRADSGTEMLHMEVYMGDGEGMLTQSGNMSYKYVSAKNYMRRSDLLDPTFLKDLPQ